MCPAPESFGIAYKIPSLIISKRASIRILKGLSLKQFIQSNFGAGLKKRRACFRFVNRKSFILPKKPVPILYRDFFKVFWFWLLC